MKQYSYIYALVDPRDDAVRYIGNAFNPTKRLRDHVRGTPKGNARIRDWILSMQSVGATPTLRVLRKVALEKSSYAETRAIFKHLKQGEKLFNLRMGGSITKTAGRSCNPMMCIETGRVFASMSEACRVQCVSMSSMSKYLRTGEEDYRGRHYCTLTAEQREQRRQQLALVRVRRWQTKTKKGKAE